MHPARSPTDLAYTRVSNRMYSNRKVARQSHREDHPCRVRFKPVTKAADTSEMPMILQLFIHSKVVPPHGRLTLLKVKSFLLFSEAYEFLVFNVFRCLCSECVAESCCKQTSRFVSTERKTRRILVLD